MTLDQYKQKEAEIKAASIAALNELKMQYARANNPYKIGDTFTDHIGSIQITSISLGVSSSKIPCAIYDGYILTAKGERRKDLQKRSAWQSNDISKK